MTQDTGPVTTDEHRHGTVCVEVKLTGTETGGAIINRDRRKREVSLKGVHVTTHTAWHARAVTLRTSAIKTTCSAHSLVDGHLGYNRVVGWEERKKQRLMARSHTYSKAAGRALEDWTQVLVQVNSLDPEKNAVIAGDSLVVHQRKKKAVKI